MRGDALSVVALLLIVLSMVALGAWARLEDRTREAIAEMEGPLLAGVGALAGVIVLLFAM